jgi:hypothetical protein
MAEISSIHPVLIVRSFHPEEMRRRVSGDEVSLESTEVFGLGRRFSIEQAEGP